MTYWALDLETSGLSLGDHILSVGMVPIRQGSIRYGEHFYSLVRPERLEALSSKGIRAHHIRPNELQEAPPLEEVLGEVEHRLGKDVLLLHYASIDLTFLRLAHKTLGKRWVRPGVVDTVVLLARLNHQRHRLDPYAKALPTSLPAARASLGLPGHLEHHALYDALATAELFLVLRAGLQAKTLRQLL